MTEAEAPAQGAAGSRGTALAIAAAIVAFGFVGSRLLGVLRTVVIADAFGSAPELDAYWVAFRVPDLIFQLLAGATLGSAFIPVFARLYRKEGSERAWRLASSVLNTVTVATAVMCVVAFVFAPVIVPLLAPGLGEDIGREKELTDKAVELTRLMLLSPFLFAVSGMVTGILNARQKFLLPAVAPMLYNVAIIFGAVFLADRWGVEGLATGVVIGSGLHLAVQVPGLVRERMRWEPILGLRDSATREVGKLMGPRMIGLAAAQANFLITTTVFASQVGAGAVSNLTYAWLVAGLPVAIFGMAFSTAAFPQLADHAADEDYETLRGTVSRVLRLIMFLTIPAAIGLALLAGPVTQVLLERGAFTSFDTAITSEALAFYCLGIIPQAGVEIHSRGFYALGDTRTPVVLTVIGMAVNLGLSALLWSEFEHQGLAFSLAMASWTEWLLLYWFYARRLGAETRGEVETIAQFAVAAAFMGLFVAAGHWLIDTDGMLAAVVTTGALIVSGGLVYGGIALAMGLGEVESAIGRVRGLLGR